MVTLIITITIILVLRSIIKDILIFKLAIGDIKLMTDNETKQKELYKHRYSLLNAITTTIFFASFFILLVKAMDEYNPIK